VGKKGVVRDKAVHRQVLEQITSTFSLWGLGAAALTHSPVTGPNGNIEYLLYALKNAGTRPIDIAAAVETAWASLVEIV
jgi:23S rRNA (cytidine1920-2'-O)/16S rRNA (cytidine1409-2'-O)-methyltransferase